jgi:hypothetical protein
VAGLRWKVISHLGDELMKVFTLAGKIALISATTQG